MANLSISLILTAGVLAGTLTLGPLSLYSQSEENTQIILNQPQPDDVPGFSVRVSNLVPAIGGKGRLAVELGFVNDALQFIKDKKKFKADFEVRLVLQDSLEQEVTTADWSGTIYASSFDETNSTEAYSSSLGKIDAAPGSYTLIVELKDVETGRVARQSGDVPVDADIPINLAVSPILFLKGEQLSRSFWLLGDDYDTEFAPDSTYAVAQVYNLAEDDRLVLSFKVGSGNARSDSGSVIVVGRGRISHIFAALDPTTISGDDARFKLMSAGHHSRLAVEQSIRISPVRRGRSYRNLAAAIETLVYIASRKEMDHLDSLEGEEQAAAFEAFWDSRDPTPETAENEYKTEYYRRVAIANERFKYHEEGWRTEMGRVFILIGPPQYVDEPGRSDLSGRGFGTREFVVWVYSTYQRRVIFERIGSDFRIVNYGEIFDLLGDEMRM